MGNESKQVPETSTARALDEELWAEHSTQIRTASGQHIITSGNDWLRRYIIEMHNSRLSPSAPSVPSSEMANESPEPSTRFAKLRALAIEGKAWIRTSEDAATEDGQRVSPYPELIEVLDAVPSAPSVPSSEVERARECPSISPATSAAEIVRVLFQAKGITLTAGDLDFAAGIVAGYGAQCAANLLAADSSLVRRDAMRECAEIARNEDTVCEWDKGYSKACKAIASAIEQRMEGQ